MGGQNKERSKSVSNILLLEDDLSLINGLSFAFKKQGFELVVARTLKEADSLWVDGKYDLLVKNICKTYGSGETAVKALKDVSFSVPKGEYVAVVGESGSGKSTLLNMIGALDTPTTGKVLIDGKDIFAMDERKLTVFRRRNIGFIFQAFNLVPELTVEQNIIFPVLLDYQKPDKKYLEELLAVLNLKERRNHLPSQLSGGQQQRVAIGRALITRPALILADEPTGNLDTQNSSEVIALLKEASKKYEQTIIMITHNRSIAQTADRVLQVSDGNLTDFGRCRE